MYSYFSKGRHKDYLYGCAPDDDELDNSEVEDSTDEFDDIEDAQEEASLRRMREERAEDRRRLIEQYVEHQYEEGKI